MGRAGSAGLGWVDQAAPPIPLLPPEVLALAQRKVVPTSEAVAPQIQELCHRREEKVRHLPHVLLGTLLRHSPRE